MISANVGIVFFFFFYLGMVSGLVSPLFFSWKIPFLCYFEKNGVDSVYEICIRKDSG